MEQKLQTKVTDSNRKEFYKCVYDHQTLTPESLVDLSQLGPGPKVLVDCCGWHYKNCFPNETIVSLENVKTLLEYKLHASQFDKMFDGRTDSIPSWPKLNIIEPAVVFDRSPLLKYQNLDTIKKVLESIDAEYRAKSIVLRQHLSFVDDSRLIDRFYNISKLSIDRHVVKKFNYDLDRCMLEVHFECKKH
jgi:hypothetical protein